MNEGRPGAGQSDLHRNRFWRRRMLRAPADHPTPWRAVPPGSFHLELEQILRASALGPEPGARD